VICIDIFKIQHFEGISGRKGGARGAGASSLLLSLHRNVIFAIQMCPDNLNSPPVLNRFLYHCLKVTIVNA